MKHNQLDKHNACACLCAYTQFQAPVLVQLDNMWCGCRCGGFNRNFFHMKMNVVFGLKFP